MTVPILHPEIQELRDEITLLRDDLADLLTESHSLVHIVKPNLLALYQTKIGAWELELLRTQVSVMRLKRKLELAQASMNRGGTPDWAAIEDQLQSEFLTWKKRMQEAVEALRAAETRTYLPPEEDREMKKLYYAMVKKLHPDLNPELTEEQHRLWCRVQDAYENGDLETLKALAQSSHDLIDSPPAKSLEVLRSERAALCRHIAETLKRIKSLEGQPPFTMKAQLNDAAWVEARRAELETKIVEAKKQEELFLTLLQPIMPRYGNVFGSN